MRIQTLIASAAIILLAACAAPTTGYAPKRTQFSRPALNTTTSATIGDSLLSQGNLSEQNGIYVTGPVEVSLYTLSGGFYPQVGSDNNGTFHSFAGANGTGEIGGVRKAWLADPAKSLVTRGEGTLCVVTILNAAACGASTIGFERVVRPAAGANNFQQTLLYNGRVGQVITIAYREFSGNLARPAFNNEVQYDLSVSRIISYKGARIEVIAADNNQIEYRVLSNFNTD